MNVLFGTATVVLVRVETSNPKAEYRLFTLIADVNFNSNSLLVACILYGAEKIIWA